MQMNALMKIVRFYTRFTLSFTKIGYYLRRLFWKKETYDFSGQSWLVTGASGGIGKAIVCGANSAWAAVYAVARNSEKLAEMNHHLAHPDRLLPCVADLSLQSDVEALAKKLVATEKKIDVLVNNVGILNDDFTMTREGHETTFAINLLNQYLLTKRLLEANVLSDNATVIMMSSAGMYTVPLMLDFMNATRAEGFNGTAAYGFHKRGQAALTAYWQEREGKQGRSFYLMHPGWADTAGVQRSLPRFRNILKSILRNAEQGADTALWLAATKPPGDNPASFWFDRKPRTAHIYRHTKKPTCTPDELVAYLDRELDKGGNAAASKAGGV